MRTRDKDRYLENENERQSRYHYIIEHVRTSVVVRVILLFREVNLVRDGLRRSLLTSR
jgi:hypothetical protein